MSTLLSALQTCILFENKTKDEIEYLLSRTIYRIDSFKRNEVIFSHDQSADIMGIILNGAVDIQKFFPSGKVVTIARTNSPSLIGESVIFSDAKHYPNALTAYKQCEILFIHRNEVIKLFSLDNQIMSNFLKSVSNSRLLLEQKIGILSLNSIQERIVCYLIHEYQNLDNSNIIRLPFSKKVWAEYINVSRTSLSRELKKMEQNGIITFKKGNIKIENLKRLKEILYK